MHNQQNQPSSDRIAPTVCLKRHTKPSDLWEVDKWSNST